MAPNATIRDVAGLLDERTAEERNETLLPRHFKCSAHTINLLSTVDVAEVPDWNKGPRAVFRKPGSKAQALWNLQNRWNSYYDSMKCLVKLVLDKQEVRTAINKILSVPGLGLFDSKDTEVIKEYLQVMTPVAICLDRMQSDTAAYMGNLLPDLMLLRQRLETVKNSNLRYAGNLVEYLLEQDDHRHGFYKRFGGLFDEDDLLMATATHPAHTLHAINYLNEAAYTTIKNRVIREMVDIVKPDSFQEEAAESADAATSNSATTTCMWAMLPTPPPPASTPWRKASSIQPSTGRGPGSSGQEGALSRRPPGDLDQAVHPVQHRPPQLRGSREVVQHSGQHPPPQEVLLDSQQLRTAGAAQGEQQDVQGRPKEDLKKGPDTHQDQE
ncbi:hypothetical protein GWK47_029856 [Chionoecetes opilio]|uniref:Uncharacterized protein n=1 Tax=Chionoecetes opilio TaxID=41210 RepID=A0A8J4YLZ7_CHIOP|nr:hypothetical protein GWK47_029856 [Chionoecetes opilio]